MRTKIASVSLAVVAFSALTLLAACGGGSSSGNGGGSAPSSGNGASLVISVYPATASVPASQQAQVQFTAFLASQSGATFTWSVNGGSSNGTISSTGLYTPPSSVPSPATVTVTATDTSATNEIGTATVTLVAASGVIVSPAALAIPAGATQTFTAEANGTAIASPTWSVNGTAGGNATVGTITAGGVYTAPLTPPAGASVTITATSGAGTGTATANVVYSNASLNGSYAFSYAGQDSGGPLAVAGSFAASSTTGQITGLEDYNSLNLGVPAQAVPISGMYTVNPDGTGTASLTDNELSQTETWQFTLGPGSAGSSAQHVILVRFDSSATGSGAMDQQNLAQLGVSSFSGTYVFGLSGFDVNLAPLEFAGRFNASGGVIPAGSGEQDINDAGFTQASADISLNGSYTADLNNPGTGRGIVTLVNSSSVYPCSCGFSFYMVDSTHLKVVEIDESAALAGDFYLAPSTAPGSYSLANLNGHYAFTFGGADLSNDFAYAQGGVMVSNGSGGITGGEIDTNDGGSAQLARSLTATNYTVDANLGRIAVPLTFGGRTINFAAYQAANGSLEVISLDPTLMSSGLAFAQTSTAAPASNVAINLTGIVNSSGNEEDVVGQFTIPSSGSLIGNIAINNSGSTASGVTLNTGSTLGAPDSNGRGTGTIQTHLATFPLAYYAVDGNTTLLFETDSSRTVLGTLAKQF